MRKARKKAYLAVCMSNLSQISKANDQFLKDNKNKFIDIVNQPGRKGGLNVGYAYVGLGGTYNVLSQFKASIFHNLIREYFSRSLAFFSIKKRTFSSSLFSQC
jgi:hypothetical protein